MLAALLMSAALTACPAEKAVYALRTETSVTARFVSVTKSQDWPSGLALRLDFHGKRQWFLPAPGGTNGENYMDRTPDPGASGWKLPDPDGAWGRLGDFQYLGFDARYTVLPSIPRAGRPAPIHFLLPTLDDALRHPRNDVERDSIPRQFFDLVACRAA